MRKAEAALEKENFNEAKLQIDSIRILYPKAFVKDYRDTLNNDLAKIDLIINAINENDRKQGDYIKNGIGLSDTAVIP